jgi:hypothetical protein
MEKNPVKLIRNPNSPEAIQARIDGYADPTEYTSVQLITAPKEDVFIDLTQHQVDQSVNFPISGGIKTTRKLVTTTISRDAQGQFSITNYYIDTRNNQWVIIKGPYNRNQVQPPLSSGSQFPRPTFGGTYGGFFASARGENWRNEGKSVDKLREAQKRIFDPTKVDPSVDQTIDQPGDRYEDDFTGG